MCIITNHAASVMAQELKRPAWLCRLEAERAAPVNICLLCTDGKCFFMTWKTREYWYLSEPLTGSFPLSLQCFLLHDALPMEACFSLSLNMIHGAVPSLSCSLIMKQTARRKQRYLLQLGRIITARWKNYCEHAALERLLAVTKHVLAILINT